MAKTTIHSDYIPDNAITSTKIAENSIGAREIATNAITTLYVADGSVSSEKLASNIDIAGTFDVTGATTLDAGLTVDTDTLVVDATNDRVGIGTDSPNQALSVESSSVGVTRINITNTGNATAGAGVQFITKNGATQVSNATLRTDNAGNFSIFTGTTSESERMRIDSTGNVGIGTNSAIDAKLKVEGDGTWIRHSGYGQLLDMGNWTDGLVRIESTGAPMYIRAAGSNYMAFDTNSIERMRIDSSGLVGIGCTPTDFATEIQATSGGNALKLRGRSASENAGWLAWTDNAGNVEAAMYATADNLIFANTTSYTERMRIDSSGNVGIGTDSPDRNLHIETAGDSYLRVSGNRGNANDLHVGNIEFENTFGSAGVIAEMRAITGNSGTQSTQGQLAFYTDDGSTYAERMRISSDGDVRINTTGQMGNATLTVKAYTNTNTGLMLQEYDTSNAYGLYTVTSDDSFRITRFVSGGYSDRLTINSSGNVGIGDTSPAHKLEIQSSDNYKAVHIKGTNAPCYTMARGTGSDAEWRMGLSGYDYDDFAISAGTGTGDKFRIDPNGNSWQGSVNNYTPRDGLHDIGQTASFNGPVASGYAEGPGGNGAAPIIHDWFVYSSDSSIGSNNYVHMKTNLLGGGTGSGNQDFTMSCFTYHNYYGYGSNYYGYGVIGWHNWSGLLYNVMKNNYGNFNLVQDSYISSDGYVVLVAYIQAGYAQFTIDWAQWAGYTFRQAKVTDVTNTSSATGAY